MILKSKYYIYICIYTIYTIYVITSSAACFLSPHSHRRAHFPTTVPMRTAMLSGVTQTAPKQIYNTSFTPTSYDATHLCSYHCLEISFTWKIHLSRRQVPPESAAVAFWGNRSLGLEIADALVQVWRDEFRNTNTSRLRFSPKLSWKFPPKRLSFWESGDISCKTRFGFKRIENMRELYYHL